MVSRKLILCLIAISLALALAGCDNSPQSTPTPTTPTTPTSPPVAITFPPAPTPQPLVPTTITFETTGGIAGIHKILTISPQGQAVYTSGTTTKTQNLPLTTYGLALQDIKTADFFNLNDTYDNGNVADDIYFNVTIKQGDRTKSVKVAQQGGKDITPKPLQDLVTQLTNIQSALEK